MAKMPLDEFVDLATLECLNQDGDHPAKCAFENDDTYLASDADDPELLLKIEFRQVVKLSAIKIVAGPDGACVPTNVKIFQGRENIGFAEAADEPGAQELELAGDAVQGEGLVVPVRFVKFQSVRSLQLFFPSTGNDQTQIKRIQLFGETAEKMDMKDWKPIKG